VGLDPTLPFALWLLPEQDCADQLATTIAELAQRHGTRAFVPHITLCSGSNAADGAGLHQAALALARRWSPLQLQVERLQAGADMFTFLFLRLQLLHPPEATLIREALEALPDCHAPAVGLHLSLLYADATPGSPAARIDGQALATKLLSELAPQLASQGRGGVIRCDRLALVQPGPGGWRDGWPWKVVSTHPLVGR
jgi:hypothetical protein